MKKSSISSIQFIILMVMVLTCLAQFSCSQFQSVFKVKGKDLESGFIIPPDSLENGKRLFLDLGRVMVLAEVTINNKNPCILWKANQNPPADV